MTSPRPSRVTPPWNPPELPSLTGLIAAHERLLVEQVGRANTPGNLEGLFAYHVLHDAARFPIVWEVSPATPAWLAANEQRLGQAPALAALGFGLWHFRATALSSAATSLASGLTKLCLRDPFPDDRVSFAFNPGTFLGIALVARQP